MTKRVIGCLFFLFFLNALTAQKTTVYLDSDKEYKNGLDLYDKKLYGAAQKCFQNHISQSKNKKALTVLDAEYYSAACAIELFHKDGEWLMKRFIYTHPESNKVKWAYFYLGKSSYRKKKYEEAIEYFKEVEIYDLSKEDLAELYFKRGYSYFEMKNYEKAKLDLYEIKDVDNKYARPAKYYYSHIAYLERNYETALIGFNQLKGDETFGEIIPYYITQIYFLQAKYDDVVKNAPQLLNDTSKVKKESEINSMIGQSYFHLKQYDKALQYLSKQAPYTTSENYQLAFCYYKSGDKQKCIPYFEAACADKDSIAESAYYHLGSCYLNQNDKAKARAAFYSAYSIGKDKVIREDALYSFARLSYETDYSPYNDATKAFEKYLLEYPNSPRKDEAYKFLVNCFSITKNYLEAMKTIDKIKSQDLVLKQAYQKMAYFYGIEQFNNLDLDTAQKYFKKAINLNQDRVITAQAAYWNAEVYYQRKDYVTAMDEYKKFQLLPGTLYLNEGEIANYNIGYCQFKLEKYNDALISFGKFITGKYKKDIEKNADAYNRRGDCYQLTKKYASAADDYEVAIGLNKIDVDYSLYQKAICNGLIQNYQEQINDLKELENRFPQSPYLVSSVMELADAYKYAGQKEKAIETYKKVITKYPNSEFVEEANFGIGALYYNMDKYDQAIAQLDPIAKKDPKSKYGSQAVEIIKNIYKEKGDPEGLEAWLASINQTADANDLDNQYWDIARKSYYVDKNYEQAMVNMDKYIKKFPAGKKILDANFCYAECAYNKAMYTEALQSYEFVLNRPNSIYTETSLIKAAYILYKDKKYDQALPYYQRLQTEAKTNDVSLSAKQGAMRSAFYLNKHDVAVEEANKVLVVTGLKDAEITEARIIRARGLYALERKDDALADYKYLLKNAKSAVGAEAHYYAASIYFDKKNYSEVEKTINALIKYPYTNNDWNTKGLLLMADVYTAKKDYESAEATLQAVIDNADKPEYIEEAKTKLQALKDMQSMRTAAPPEPSQDFKIEFNNSNQNNDLFETPAPSPVPNSTPVTNPEEPKK